MLIIFSIGWYCSIGKMLLTKKASGKSLGFVGLICSGYLCGVLAKLANYHETGVLSGLIWVYGWNFCVTFFDGWLVVMLTRRENRKSERKRNRDKKHRQPMTQTISPAR